jgi:hypothetical protein
MKKKLYMFIIVLVLSLILDIILPISGFARRRPAPPKDPWIQHFSDPIHGCRPPAGDCLYNIIVED